MSRHVMECLGLSRVTIVDGKVVDVTEPRVRYCPLFAKRRGMEELNKDSIRENIEFRIQSFGMCSEDRVTEMDNFLNFGMGGRISGICETEPIPKVVEAVGMENMLDPETARIDMEAGVDKAFSMGYERVAVTTPFVDSAVRMREKYGDRLVIIGVHTTGMSEEDAVRAFDTFDIITACASKYLREECLRRPDTLVAGNKVPVYGVTTKGKKLVQDKLDEVGKEPWHPGEPTQYPDPLI